MSVGKARIIVYLLFLTIGIVAVQSVKGEGVRLEPAPLGISSQKHVEMQLKGNGKPLHDDRIFLKSRTFTPFSRVEFSKHSRSRSAFGVGKKFHALIQLERIPDEEDKKALEENGIKLLSYIPNKAWLVSVSTNAGDISSLPLVRWAGELLPEDKMSPYIREGGGVWARNRDGTVNLTVLFFEDTSIDEARQVVQKYGKVTIEPTTGDAWGVAVLEYLVSELAGEDIVKWVDYSHPPYMSFNDGSRASIGVDVVQLPPYNLNGTGVTVAMWEEGHADKTHNDFSGRVIYGDSASVTEHATHVAGTLMGNGIESNGLYRGMAPNATLITYEWPYIISKLYSETNASIANYSAVLSQNSWGYNVHGDCSMMGNYDDWSQAYDNIIYGNAGLAGVITIVFAAGNERGSDPDGVGGFYCGHYGHTYNTIVGPGGTAKNVITVGAVKKSRDMSSFSSWGPTDDGRIKPDVVAIGVSVTSTFPGNTYKTLQGTSMAAPAVSGVVALIHEDYRRLYSGGDPLPSTVKALLIQTAEDLNNTGPDYTSGWGLINATAAIDLIMEDNGSSDLVRENSISNNQVYTYHLSVASGQDKLKITLVWDDYPGTVLAVKELINDLDLVVLAPNGSRFYPWTLDSSNPSASAVQDTEDHTNNVEQVYVFNPVTGIWTVIVNGTTVPYAPQNYSLISNTKSNVIRNIDKGVNYNTIQEAVNDANAGNTLLVLAATISENVKINKTLNLKGGGVGSTIVKAANANEHIFEIINVSVNISGFTIKGANGSEAAGVYLNKSSTSNISLNRISNNQYGIKFYDSNSGIISYNTISDNSYGIKLYDSNSGVISYNTIISNSYGINLSNTNGAWIYHNNFTNNSLLQAYDAGNNTWNSSYLGGGNYWSNRTFPDIKMGPSQNVNGSDGIVDSAYTIPGGSNQDNYPFVYQSGWTLVTNYYNTTTVENGTTATVIDQPTLVVKVTAIQDGNAGVQIYTMLSSANYLFGVGEINASSAGIDQALRYLNAFNISSLENVSNITIRLYYTSEEISGLDNNSIAFLYWNGSVWFNLKDYIGQNIPGGPHVYAAGLNMSNDYVYAVVDHLSVYAMGGNNNVAPRITFTGLTPANVASFAAGTSSVTINVSIAEENPDTLVLNWKGINTSYSYSSGYWSRTKSVSNGESVTFYIWANDTSGKSNQTETRSFSVQSGGGGGGGGGVPVATDQTAEAKLVTPTDPDVVVQVKATFSSIPKDKTGTISIPDTENMPLTEIAIKVLNKVSNVKVAVKTLTSKPTEIAQEIVGEVFKYLEIEHENIEDADIDNVTIRFKVEKTWTTERNIDPATVVLNRFSEDNWNALTTTKVSEDSNYTYYSAESLGLSVFGISGSVTLPPPAATPASTTLPLATTLPPTTPPPPTTPAPTTLPP
ncbi:MAG: S8 family serine peptidase, partial [Candidatus Hydrothermarchaeales archaeon]